MMLRFGDWAWLAEHLHDPWIYSEHGSKMMRLTSRDMPSTIRVWTSGSWPLDICQEISQTAIESYLKASGVDLANRNGGYLKRIAKNEFLDAVRKRETEAAVISYQHQSPLELDAEGAERQLDWRYFDRHSVRDDASLTIGRIWLLKAVRKVVEGLSRCDEQELLLVTQLYVEELHHDPRQNGLELKRAVRAELRRRGVPANRVRSVIPRWTRHEVVRPFLLELARALPR